MDFLRINNIPRELRKRVYPYATRVLHSKAELIAAVDAHAIAIRGRNRTGQGAVMIHYPMGEWDVSNITDFSHVFDAEQRNPLLRDFNEDLSDWNVLHATNMKCMFRGCEVFRSDLSRWQVSNVTDFSYMFSRCKSFVSDVSRWNVSNATTTYFMFEGCGAFCSDISNWNVSNATNLSGMFWNCGTFHSDVSNWNVSNATDLSYLYSGRAEFRSDVSRWDVTNATDMRCMFRNCLVFHFGRLALESVQCFHLERYV